VNAPRTLPRRDAAAEHEALRLGVRLLDREPLDLRALIAVHRRLLPSAHPYRGRFRDRGAVIRLGGRVHWRPPPPNEARRQTEDVLGWLRREGRRPELAGEAMARLTAAHPFLDGNGRVALTVATWLLEGGGFSLRADPIRYCRERKPELYSALAANDRAPPAPEWERFFAQLVDVCFEPGGGRA
jgi:fido (protein-threonine AMPylation protein)